MSARMHAGLANFIWRFRNVLRGAYKRNYYRKVILPLAVLRRFDCILAEAKEPVGLRVTGSSLDVEERSQ